MDYALITDKLQVVTHASGDVDVVTPRQKPVDRYQLKPLITREVLNELSRFYK